MSKKNGNDVTDLNNTLEEELRRELVNVKKENNILRAELEMTKAALIEEVKEKYVAYQKIAQLS